MAEVTITGGAGFIMSHVANEFADAGYDVVVVDDFSRPDRRKSFPDFLNPAIRKLEINVENVEPLVDAASNSTFLVCGAARVGGIGYFHKHPYSIISHNERLNAAHFDAGIQLHREHCLARICVLSSCAVFESATAFPSPEGSQFLIPPPRSVYGFQKLAGEYFARAAYEEFGLPYTIVRPFNTVGAFENLDPGQAAGSTHVVPDLVAKIAASGGPLELIGDGTQVRHFIHVRDVARGIRLALESEHGENNDFNLASEQGTSIKALAEAIWSQLRPREKISFAHTPAFPDDVHVRSPDIRKSQELLGFSPTCDLDEMIADVIRWMRDERYIGPG